MDDDLEQARYTLYQAAKAAKASASANPSARVIRHEGSATVRIEGATVRIAGVLTLEELRALVWVMGHSQEPIEV